MSAYSLKFAKHRGIGLPVQCVTGGVLLLATLLLLLPSVAFAFTPSTAGVADPPQNVAQAGVSVVRLVASYTAPVGNTPPPQCTGLGVLVKSWAAGPSTEKSSWVLTAGSLLNPAKMTCAGNSPVSGAGGSVSSTGPLTKIQVLVSSGSNGYTATSTTPLPLATLSVKAEDVICEKRDACNQGLALIGFSTPQAQPFIDPSTASSSTGQKGIELINSAAAGLAVAAQANQYLTPQAVPVNAVSEAGMPIVDAVGNLVGMHLLASTSTVVPLATIKQFLASNIPQNNTTNTLHENWNKGIQDYYKHDYAAAENDFKLAFAANNQFVAANAFMKLAATHVSAGNGSGLGNSGQENTGHTPKTGSTNGLLGFSLWQVSVAGLILLLLIVALVSFFMARARTRRQDMKKYKEDEKAAEHQAAVDAQHIARMEARQAPAQAQPQGMRNGRPLSPAAGEPVASPPAPIMNESNMQAQPHAAQIPLQASPVLDRRCPHCGLPVASSVRVCPQCNTPLSAPDASQLSPAAPPYQQQQSPASPPPVAPLAAPPLQAPPPLAAPAPSYAQAAPQFAAADQPTLVYAKNGQSGDEPTVPVPYNIRKAGSADVGLAVITRTNPGIKRKHKPNEDSLFAAQGAGMFNASPHQFGLFVVADGMGGHANGQDASRLAIQTIIDYVLPRLSGGSGLDSNALVQLLTDGVQHANQAVFQSNMQQHADMGTTMTTSLVVGTTAYVANVGDSRTYLYREPEGLTKITNDHSVVASLVEAGIIKPDDIYTHPKRNQIYRSLGEKPAVEVDSFVVDLRPGDKLLLCTDGLWDMVRDPAIQQVLRNPTASPDQTGDALIDAALKGGGEDNVSVIVVYVTGSTQQSAKTGLRLLYKPESVQMPPM